MSESKTWTLDDGREVAVIDVNTGEVIDPEALMVQRKVPGGHGMYWWRVMMTDMIKIFDDIPGKQVKAVFTILDAVQPWDNRIIATQDQLAERAGCSRKTLYEAMLTLRRHHIIKKVMDGVYMADPHVMSQGGGINKYHTLVLQYTAANDMRVVDGGRGNDQHDQVAEG